MRTRTNTSWSSPAAWCASVMLRFAGRALEACAVGTVLTVLAGPGHALAVEPWPEMPLPPKANVQWVAQSMRVNGVPTRVMQFQSSVGRAEIVAYYRAHWSGGYEHEPSVHVLPTQSVVGQLHGAYLMTVKVEDAAHGASHGLISVAQVIGVEADLNPGQLPMITGAHVVSVVESDDPGKHSRDTVVLAPQPPASVIQFYQASFVNAGWQQVQGKDTFRDSGGPVGSFVAFARDGNEMQLTVVPTPKGRGSTVLANLVTKDTRLSSY